MKQLVTEFHALPINDLARQPLIPFTKLEWVWRTHKNTQETMVPINVLQDALELHFPIGAERARQTVQLTSSLGPHGGDRMWFVCPTCQRRVGVLYHKNGLPFLCRTCHQLAYPSQYEARNRSHGRHFQTITPRDRDKLSVRHPA